MATKGIQMSTSSNSMYSAHVISEAGPRSIWEDGKKTGFCLNLKINYYRGLPLSCIDEITLAVDDRLVDPETMYVTSEGKTFHYPDILKDDMDNSVYWRFGKLLKVTVMQPGGLEQGVHNVKLRLGTRRSYTPTMISTCEKDLTFA